MNAVAELMSNNNPGSDYPNGLRAFTFWVNDTLYAIDIAKVLTISQELANIQNLPAHGKGLMGMIEFQEHAIPVVDFAKMLNLESGNVRGANLIKSLEARENDHHEWLNSLEDSLINGSPFLKAKDPHECAFGKWYDQFNSRDETLMEIMEDFAEPHKQIHSLADKLLNMYVAGESEKALDILRLEREITMKRLSRHFSQAREHIKESSRAVLLYITEDGRTPTLALQIDDIHDVIDFKATQFKPMNTVKAILGVDESKLINAYIKQVKTADCLLIDASRISEIIRV